MSNISTMFNLTLAFAAASAVLPAHADEDVARFGPDKHAGAIRVSVTNLTNGTWFAPILVAAHPAGYAAFEEGRSATVELQNVAEIGNIGPLAASLPAGSNAVLNPAHGPLKPGGTATTEFFAAGRGTTNSRLSIFAMLVPTNDGFTALNAIAIPKEAGTYVYTLSGYDAGTEANDEARANGPGINQPGMGLPAFLNDADGNPPADIYPDAPGFAQVKAEGYVHVHRGIVGGMAGGPSALDQASYRWMNPVAKVTLTVR